MIMGKVKRKQQQLHQQQSHQQVTSHHLHHRLSSSFHHHQHSHNHHHHHHKSHNNHQLSSPSLSPSSSSLSPTSSSSTISPSSSCHSSSSRASSPSSSPWKSPHSLHTISDEDSGIGGGGNNSSVGLSSSSPSSSPETGCSNINGNGNTGNGSVKVARFNNNNNNNSNNSEIINVTTATTPTNQNLGVNYVVSGTRNTVNINNNNINNNNHHNHTNNTNSNRLSSMVVTTTNSNNNTSNTATNNQSNNQLQTTQIPNQHHPNHLLHQPHQQHVVVHNQKAPFSKRTLNALPPPPPPLPTHFQSQSLSSSATTPPSLIVSNIHQNSNNNNLNHVSSSTSSSSSSSSSVLEHHHHSQQEQSSIGTTSGSSATISGMSPIGSNTANIIRSSSVVRNTTVQHGQNSVNNHHPHHNLANHHHQIMMMPVRNHHYHHQKQTVNQNAPPGLNPHQYNQNSIINNRSAPCAYPSRSKNGKYELKILSQPEEQHRARYLTEGSRGAIKDKSGQGYPIVKLCGYTRQPVKIHCFIGHDKHIGVPHLFYQASKIAGKNSTACLMKKMDGTSVITMEASPANNMEVNVDCIGILKERNVDVEQKLNKFQKVGNGTTTNGSGGNNTIGQINNNHNTSTQNGNIDNGGGGDSVTNIKRSTRCRLVFRCEIPETSETLQVVSTPIICTQPLGTPEINKKSMSHCSIDGGEELFIIGKNFLKDAKVIFRNDKWLKIVEPNREYLKSTHLICKIPPYEGPVQKLSPLQNHNQSSNIKTCGVGDQQNQKVIEVSLMVKSGGKHSEPQKFYYRIADHHYPHQQQRTQTTAQIINRQQPGSSSASSLSSSSTVPTNHSSTNTHLIRSDSLSHSNDNSNILGTNIKLETDLQSPDHQIEASQTIVLNSMPTIGGLPTTTTQSTLALDNNSFDVSTSVVTLDNNQMNSKDTEQELLTDSCHQKSSNPLVQCDPNIASLALSSLNQQQVAMPVIESNTTLNLSPPNQSNHILNQFIDQSQSQQSTTVLDANQQTSSNQQQQQQQQQQTQIQQSSSSQQANNLFNLITTTSATSTTNEQQHQGNHHPPSTLINSSVTSSSVDTSTSSMISFMAQQPSQDQSSSTSGTLSTSPNTRTIKQEELVVEANNNLMQHALSTSNPVATNTTMVDLNQTTGTGQLDQCSSGTLESNQFLNQVLMNANSTSSFPSSMMQTSSGSENGQAMHSILCNPSANNLVNGHNSQMANMSTVQVVTHQLQPQTFVQQPVDHPMTIKNEADNQSPPQLTSQPQASLPEISLQDINKQFISLPPQVVPTEPSQSTNTMMAMEGVQSGGYSSKSDPTSESNQIPPLINNPLNGIAASVSNGTVSNVTMMDQQSSISEANGLITSNPNNGLLPPQDFQMMNIAPPTREFPTNNTTMLDSLMNGLNANTNNTTNFMQALQPNTDQPTIMMATECNTMINTVPVTVTMTDVTGSNQTLSVLEQVHQNQIQQNLINQMNNAVAAGINQQTNQMAMAVDPMPQQPPPTITTNPSPQQTVTIGSGKLTSFCQENKVNLSTIQSTNMPQEINTTTNSTNQTDHVFLTNLNAAVSNEKSEIISQQQDQQQQQQQQLQQPVPMQTNQSTNHQMNSAPQSQGQQPPPTAASNSTTNSVLSNDMTSIMSSQSINSMSKMSDAELMKIINPQLLLDI